MAPRRFRPCAPWRRIDWPGKSTLFILPPCRGEQRVRLTELFGLSASAQADPRRQFNDPRRHLPLSASGSKGAEEIAEMERAVAVTKAVHEDLLHSLEPGWTEKAAADYFLSRASARGLELSFATIASAGEPFSTFADRVCCDAEILILLDAALEMPSRIRRRPDDDPPGMVQDWGRSPRQNTKWCTRPIEAASGALAPGLRFIEAHKLASLAIAKG